jgi:hypothetical protein
MPRHCRLADPLDQYPTPAPLGVNAQGAPAFECIRLLFGTIDTVHKDTGERTRNKYCFVTQKNRRRDKHTISRIVKHIFDDDLSIEDTQRFLTRAIRDNREFWEDLKAEICLCLAARAKGRHVEAFLYLYRILEVVSLALPLVYASSEPDYRKAMQFIKSLSNNDRDSDLTVFRSFVDSTARLGGYSDLSFDFVVDSQPAFRDEVHLQLERFVFSNGKIDGGILDDGTGFYVLFTSMPLFFVTCRNRLFHNSRTNDNFNLDYTSGAGTICQSLIDPTLYWFSLVMIEIIKTHAKRYV